MGINYGVEQGAVPDARPGRLARPRRGRDRGGVDIAGGVQAVIKITVELEGSDKPACVVENVTRYLR